MLRVASKSITGSVIMLDVIMPSVVAPTLITPSTPNLIKLLR
jgi:hypothetical protein